MVGVLRGGPSNEYEVSLKTGAALIGALPEDKYDVHDVFIDRGGLWNYRGRARDPLSILHRFDVVLNGMHGAFGEDGTVQRILERAGVPYSGSRPGACALAMHKVRTREALSEWGVNMPHGVVFYAASGLSGEDMARAVFEQFGPPYVIKPPSCGSSVGVFIAEAFPDLASLIEDALAEYESVLVEEYIRGKEATVGVIDHFRNQEIYALPPVEIVPVGRRFFDYAAKYEGASKEICPGSFSAEHKRKLENIAREIHGNLGLSHYSRADFIVHPSGRIYFLEVNALPGLTPESLLPKALVAVGSSLPDFAEHLVWLAQNKR